MAFSSQAFIAPSINPKMRKTSVSSSVLGGGNKPKLNKTTVSSSIFAKGGYGSIFRGNNVDPKYLKQKVVPLEETLLQTNNILTEIQNQLALDFASRITEQQEQIKAFRKQSEEKDRSREENRLEGTKKFAQKADGVISKVTKPFKSIFDKIFEFLSIVGTGLIVNNALKWLSNPENRKKISNVFNWLADNWKILAGIIVGGVALKALYKLVRLVRVVRGALQFLRILPRGRTVGGRVDTSTSRGGLVRNAEGQRRGITTSRLMRNGIPQTRAAATAGGGGIRTTGVSQFTRAKTPLAKVTQMAEVLTAKAGKDILKKIGLGPGAKGIMRFLRPIFKRIPVFGALIDFAVSLALGEPIGRAAAKAVGAALGGALGSLIPIPGVGTIAGGILGDFVGGKIYDAMTGDGEGGKKFRMGGKLSGPSHASGGIKLNSRGDEAEGGEFVVNKRDTIKYEPILSDINYNGGRMWEQFVDGVKIQTKVADESLSHTKKMGELFEEYEKLLTIEKNKKTMPAMGGGEKRPGLKQFMHEGDTMPMDDKNGNKRIAPILVKSPDLTKPKKAKPKISTIQLPPITMDSNGKLPPIKTAGDTKTIPMILPYDTSNEYLDIASDSYDIVGLSFGGR